MSGVAPGIGVPIDLATAAGRAVVWGLASEDLNVNLVAWPDGEGVDEHRNTARDVLIVVTSGDLAVTIDGATQFVSAGQCILIPKGAMRRLVAGAGGVRYLTVHWRRPGLTVERPPA